ncbi:hypothetical protein [Nocardiopsis sp. YSL2]|uniref:hypothetical protein n=1 Tax=Nocardiopsis sp. YSL2 TaxID=2939492 RepID=UPI0026F430B7|nr:hypothetical protein [Nocardiopsis sp. YSL2]
MSNSEYTLLVPFVLVTSQGGPFNDAAFVAGATCGALMEELRVLRLTCATPRERYIDDRLLPQVDLIAMNHGYTVIRGALDEASGWRAVSFEFTGDTADDIDLEGTE